MPPKRYRVRWIPPKTYRLFCSCSFFVHCYFWFFGFLFGIEPLCGREDPTPAHTPAPTPAPIHRSAWSSRGMSGLEGNPSAISSRMAGSATSSSVEAGAAVSSAPGSDDPVDGSEPVVLQPPSRAETCLLYTSPSPRDLSTSRMPSSA